MKRLLALAFVPLTSAIWTAAETITATPMQN
jgi:hypothetical protein